MKKAILVILTVFITLGRTEEIVFIVNKSLNIDKADKDFLVKIFLREVDFIDGYEVVPVNLPPNNPLRKIVERKLLKMTREELSIYWNKKYLDGIEPPLVLESEEAVKEFVKKVKGAVGYISSKKLDKDLKVIFKLNYEDEFKD